MVENISGISIFSTFMIVLASFCLAIRTCCGYEHPLHPFILGFYLCGSIGWAIFGFYNEQYLLCTSAGTNSIMYLFSFTALFMKKRKIKPPEKIVVRSFNDSNSSLTQFPLHHESE